MLNIIKLGCSVVVLASVFAMISGLHIKGDEIKLIREKAAGFKKSHSLNVVLSVAESVSDRGSLDLDIRFINISGGNIHLYNPFFNSLIVPGARACLYDVNEKYITDIELARLSMSCRSPGAHDWVYIDPNSYVGTRVKIVLRNGTTLSKGKYWIQFFGHSCLINGPPSFRGDEKDIEKDVNEWCVI